MDQPKKAFSFKRLVKLLLLALLLFYIAICVTMAVIQRSLEYNPHVYSSKLVDQMARDANLERWTNSAGDNIGLKRPSPQQPAQGSVLITYGNGSSAVNCDGYTSDIQNVAALDVYILEYPGYEDRPGPPTEKNIFAAASDALQMIPTNRPVYLVGQSLGTGVASYLAGTYPGRIAGVLLLSPFNSTASVGQHRYPFLPVSLLIADSYRSDEFLRNYHGKIGITVDGRDTVVPEKFGLRLYNGYDGPKKLWQFPDGHHCEITEPKPKFWQDVVAFWQGN